MLEFKKVLFPTDFSHYADYAMRYANAFARSYGAELHCAHIVDSRAIHGGGVDGVYVSSADLDDTLKAVTDHAKEQMEHVVRKAKMMDIEAQHHVRTGTPAKEVVALASEIGADLIVMSTHGRSGLDRLVLGSTCEKVMRRSPIPVLAIKHPEHEFVEGDNKTLHVEKIMCPVDFSDFSHKAVPTAADLCRRFGATLYLTHVVDTWLDYPEFAPSVELSNSPHLVKAAQESLDKLASEQEGIDTKVEVMTGVPHRRLAEYIKNQDIDLVIMATHGRTGVAHALLGSIAEKVVRMSHSPVMTIRPAEAVQTLEKVEDSVQ